MRSLPTWVSMLGFAAMIFVSFTFIFFVARGCVASQESTEIRRYITGADSTLSDSANLGSARLQPVLAEANGDPANLNVEEVQSIAEEERTLYQNALTNDDIPPEFSNAHPYLVSALGVRVTATDRLAAAAGGDAEGFQQELSGAVEDFIVSDRIVQNHYLPASETALTEIGRESDQSYLYEPAAFMDYEGVGAEEQAEVTSNLVADNPDAVHGVEIVEVSLAGDAFPPGAEATLSGSDEPRFEVTVLNGGEVPEADVPVEVIINTATERQSQSTNIDRLESQDSATVEVAGFRPGELNETAEVTVEIGPVNYEEFLDNNTLTGTVTFGI